MNLGVLFSGGKDSCLALYEAMYQEHVSCLISLCSKNKESYMFHTPNNSILGLQAQALGLPLVKVETSGEKEAELGDLRSALERAKQDHAIEGVVTGAVGSVYQATRIQKICDELDLWCFNPLWQRDQVTLLHDVLDAGMQVIIAGVFAEPFDESWLGEEIDEGMIGDLEELQETHKINPAGEGGEMETTVLDAPFFKGRIEIERASSTYNEHAGTYDIEKATLVKK